MSRPNLIALCALVLVLGIVPTAMATEPGPSAVPIDVLVPIAPAAVMVDGKPHLIYELHLTNMKAPPLEIAQVEVLDQRGKVVGSYSGKELEDSLKRPGLEEQAKDIRILAGGLRAVLFLDLSVAARSELATSLSHRITIIAQSGNRHVFTTEPLTLPGRLPRSIASPLRGGGWLAANGVSNVSDHRRSLIVVDGRARIAQRFATDFTLLRDGQAFHDDPAVNSNWYAYGMEVRAVADAVVSDVHDGVPENDPSAGKMAVPITLQTVGGNYVILDLGGGEYAFYAHLQPGRIRVHLGQRVRRGEVLALLGNSGNSDAPHLHFHIADRNSPLGAEGIPYVFDSFDVEGKLPSLEVLEGGAGWKRPAGAVTEHRTGEIPAENEVVDFAEK
ncbi:MAG: M23 family metallopeptidase [Acidobacteriota bacterium]